MNVVDFICANKLVAISRGVYTDDLVKAVQAVIQGGIKVLEITFDQSNKQTGISNTANSIAQIKERFGQELCVGAGTVMTIEQARAAKEAGADFALAPNTDVEVIKAMKDLGLIAVPGALTPSEISTAFNAGADIVKVFPVSTLGVDYIKAVRAPISHIKLMAVGGVSEANVKSFLDNGFCSAGIGSNIINAKKVANGEFDSILRSTQAFVNAIK